MPSLWDFAPAAAAAVGAVAAWGAFHPASQVFGPTIRSVRGPRGKKSFALTFDDGPNPAITPQLLDLLERHSAHATFFLIGRFARACPELVREIAARGHSLGNHTETHPSLAWCSPARIRTELASCQEAIAGALGISDKSCLPQWMRPPFGFRAPYLDLLARREGFRGVVMWSVMCFDWKPQPPGPILRRLGRVHAGDIVLLHDGDYRRLGGDRRHVLDGLEHWLPRWRDQGLEFVTMNELTTEFASARGTVSSGDRGENG